MGLGAGVGEFKWATTRWEVIVFLDAWMVLSLEMRCSFCKGTLQQVAATAAASTTCSWARCEIK